MLVFWVIILVLGCVSQLSSSILVDARLLEDPAHPFSIRDLHTTCSKQELHKSKELVCVWFGWLVLADEIERNEREILLLAAEDKIFVFHSSSSQRSCVRRIPSCIDSIDSFLKCTDRIHITFPFYRTKRGVVKDEWVGLAIDLSKTHGAIRSSPVGPKGTL